MIPVEDPVGFQKDPVDFGILGSVDQVLRPIDILKDHGLVDFGIDSVYFVMELVDFEIDPLDFEMDPVGFEKDPVDFVMDSMDFGMSF